MTDPLRLYDNTRVSDFKRCPRYFMFRHEFHWQPTGKRVPLIFGSGWHAAMETIWGNYGKVPKHVLAERALGAFLQVWCGEGMPAPAEIDFEMEKELSPRTPGRAFEMIVSYIDARASRMADLEVLAIERPFAVPLDPNDDTLFYVGKIDKVVRDRSKIIGIEHKTTTAYKKNGPFRAGFTDSFSPNSQVDGYLYALHLMFPNQAGSIWVDAALVHKQEEGFIFIPIERQLRHLDSWLWEVQEWIKLIEHNKYELGIWDADEPYLRAFPKNTNSCWDFAAACPYMDLCKAWPNPKGYDVPAGYEVSRWDPLEHVKGLDKVIEGKDARSKSA